jgi:hypothetical protein
MIGDIGIIVSTVIILYGSMIYLLLSLINIKVENIILVSVVTSCCIITYDVTYKFCNVVYDLHIRGKKNTIINTI